MHMGMSASLRDDTTHRIIEILFYSSLVHKYFPKAPFARLTKSCWTPVFDDLLLVLRVVSSRRFSIKQQSIRENRLNLFTIASMNGSFYPKTTTRALQDPLVCGFKLKASEFAHNANKL